jgi:alpha-beta hydrolase superfamily lysophospholipase
MNFQSSTRMGCLVCLIMFTEILMWMIFSFSQPREIRTTQHFNRIIQSHSLDSADTRKSKYPPSKHPHYTDSSFHGEHIRGDFDGIFYQINQPHNDIDSISAVIVLIHGYGDHSDYLYPKHAKRFYEGLDENVAVVYFDQPSFGRSDGLWADIPDWFQHAEKCEKFISELVRKQFPGKKVFAFAVSMGGGLAITLAINNPTLFDGIILSAPMCKVGEAMKPSGFVLRILRFLATYLPKFPLAPIPDVTMLSYRDSSVAERVYEENHLGYISLPRLGTAFELLRAQEWISDNMEKLTTPFLLLHGSKDVVTSPDSSKELYDRSKSEDKEFKLLENYAHIIVGAGQDEQFDDLPYSLSFDWIKKRLL